MIPKPIAIFFYEKSNFAFSPFKKIKMWQGIGQGMGCKIWTQICTNISSQL
jgi:hypothetical protein